ncbi:hypothetical protein M1I95_04395 [Rossellomorea marisflavi]|uniref:hypothetical protein n=1 Tax=Rossellomorea marisflavi TaxID=189381 RepID=UPI00279978F7|nr:hypothetical protein [Rossellomorea marisflavi]UTE73761.1 hypothetical protein M1I95_04395 [Rossellomorea marisflavi]
MNKDTSITLQYSVEKEDYIKLFSHSPVIRKLKWFVTFATLFTGVLIYVTMQLTDVLYYGNKLRIFNEKLIIFSLIVFIIFCIYTFRKTRRKILNQANENYKDIYEGRSFTIEYEIEAAEFLVGNRRKRVPVDSQLEIYKTKKSNFFYWRKSLEGKIFLVPAYGSNEYMNKLDKLFEYIYKEGKVKTRELDK